VLTTISWLADWEAFLEVPQELSNNTSIQQQGIHLGFIKHDRLTIENNFRMSKLGQIKREIKA